MKTFISILMLTCTAACFSVESQSLKPSETQVEFKSPASPDSAKSATKEQVAKEEQEDGIVYFVPPTGWRLADNNLLPSHVKVMVVGTGPSLPPSMNLSIESYKGTLKQYLKTIKNMNDAQGYEWKDLGTIKTDAGIASLSQVDTKSQWGDVRLMHVILLKNGKIYILTASALKQDFSTNYKDFFAAMRSLRVAKDAYELVIDAQERSQLKTAAGKLETQWQTLLKQKQQENPEMAIDELKENVFKSEQFQNSLWKPFKEMLDQKYNHLGPEWQSLFMQKMEDNLFDMKN